MLCMGCLCNKCELFWKVGVGGIWNLGGSVAGCVVLAIVTLTERNVPQTVAHAYLDRSAFVVGVVWNLL